MATIRPFRAIRPAKGLEERIAALPYDVYSREEAKEIVTKNPMSFLKIDRAETQFSDLEDIYAPQVYEKARETLQAMRQRGEYVQEEKPCFYLYELTMEGRTQTGIVACASVDEYEQGIIRKHENTREDKELDRIRHVDVCNAQTGPIFLAYRQTEELQKLVLAEKEKPSLYDFTADDQVRHQVWVISDNTVIDRLQQAFKSVPRVYIADGHHRAASAVAVAKKRRMENPGYTGEEEFNYFLSVFFPDEELKILDYNRVVMDLNGNTEEEFLKKLEDSFLVEQALECPYHPDEKGRCGLYLAGKWYTLQVKAEYVPDDPVEGLDVSILQKQVLSKILNIQNPKTDSRIQFCGGIRGLGELERLVQDKAAAAFSMYPTSIQELFAVADANLLMPPKSTWFEPKLRSGLFIHEL